MKDEERMDVKWTVQIVNYGKFKKMKFKKMKYEND